MKGRGGAFVLALVLAGVATAGVFLYVRGARPDGTTVEDLVTVIAAKRDIPAGTSLDPLVDEGAFGPLLLPTEAVVPGAVTELDQLQGRSTNAFILEGEQISTARLQGTSKPTGGPLGIPQGMQAMSVSLPGPQAGGGFIQAQDHVAVYATFSKVELVRFRSLDRVLAGTEVPSTEKVPIGDYTVTVVADAAVLRVVGGSTSTVVANSAEIQLTLALSPKDVQRVIFAKEKGSVWLGLVPPAEEGVMEPPISVGDILVPTGPGAV